MSALLPEFQQAFPTVGEIEALQAHLLQRGWTARTTKLPVALEAYLDLVPLMLQKGTQIDANTTLVKTMADRDLWIVLQRFAIGALSLTMVAFFDFAATEPIDPDAITALIGSPPQSARQVGDGAEASWERASAPDAASALTVNLGFAPPGARMPGARIVALTHAAEPERAP
jgi:hypothetical protein